jgi:sec-independent protein translocase protein TatB
MIENIGFSELLMVGVVALLVIGPERLPKVARMLGYWIGKTRLMVATMKEELKHELHTEELHQLMKEQGNSLNDLQNAFDDMANSAHNLQTEFDQKTRQMQSPLTRHEKE